MKRGELIIVAALAVLVLVLLVDAISGELAPDEPEPVEPEPVESVAVESEPDEPEPVEPVAVESEPDEPEPVESVAVESEPDEWEPPKPSPWDPVCSNPIARIQPAIARTGLKIADDYDRSRGRIIDGIGPWGSYSSQCGTLVERPELGEGLMVDIFLGPKNAQGGFAGTPIRCKRMATSKEVVERVVAHLRSQGVPLDRPVSAYMMCTNVIKGLPRAVTESQAIYNPNTQSIEIEKIL